MTWKQLLESFLLSPEQTIQNATQHSMELACLSIFFIPETDTKDLLSILAMNYASKAILVENFPNALYPSADELSLQLFFSKPSEALEAALCVDALVASCGIHCTASLGYGSGLLIDDRFNSLENLRTKRLNQYSNIHEITATSSFMQSIQLPDGVGSFSGSRKMQQIVGFAFWILKDYR